MKTIIEDYIENIVTNHMNIIRKNQCADLLLFCVDILINNSENNNYEKDLNHMERLLVSLSILPILINEK